MKPLFEWASVKALHVSTDGITGPCWYIVKLGNRKRAAIVRFEGNVLTPVAYFNNEDEAKRFAALFGGWEGK